MMPSSIYSAAGTALGFGGAALSQQVKDQADEEERKKRLGLSALQSPAGIALMSSPFLKG